MTLKIKVIRIYFYYILCLFLDLVVYILLNLGVDSNMIKVAISQNTTYYAELIRCLNYAAVAAECSVPIRSSAIRSAEKHWWSEELDDFKSRSVESHRMWIDAGRPHTGPIFDNLQEGKVFLQTGYQTREKSSY